MQKTIIPFASCKSINTKDNREGLFEGYASVFNIVDLHNDIIQQGAFIDSKPKDIKLLWQHDPAYPIGAIESLQETAYGLLIQGRIITSNTKGMDVYTLLKNNVISGLSIGFEIIQSCYNETGQRLISKLKLWEISLVTFPANQEAIVITVKSKENMLSDKEYAMLAITALWGKPLGNTS